MKSVITTSHHTICVCVAQSGSHDKVKMNLSIYFMYIADDYYYCCYDDDDENYENDDVVKSNLDNVHFLLVADVVCLPNVIHHLCNSYEVDRQTVNDDTVFHVHQVRFSSHSHLQFYLVVSIQVVIGNSVYRSLCHCYCTYFLFYCANYFFYYYYCYNEVCRYELQ